MRAHFTAMNRLPCQQTDFGETLFLNLFIKIEQNLNVEIIQQGRHLNYTIKKLHLIIWMNYIVFFHNDPQIFILLEVYEI
jgi:hypothetical protein